MPNFTCRGCGHIQEFSWRGKPCPACGGLWSIVQPRHRADARATLAAALNAAPPTRISTGIDALDAVLGGGIVAGSTGSSVLLGGPRGIGKTTLLLEAANGVGEKGEKVLFASGEMTTQDVLTYARRLGVSSPNVEIVGNASSVEDLCERAEEIKASLFVLDSIQTVRVGDLEADAGTPPQVREVMNHLSEWVKQKNICLIAIGHMGKGGEVLAGPESIQHLCDTILDLYLYDVENDPLDVARRKDGELIAQAENLRVLACSEKNRYGSTPVRELVLMAATGIKPFRRRSKLELV
jgi:DNA repair protein RadA/Sms